MIRCPACGKTNPAGSLRCDCGCSDLTGEFPKEGASEASAGAPPPPADTPPPVDYRLEFRGTAREYFGIWIVNMLLKIVTLGFYTAWAKVRQRRYFAGTTLLAGEPFEYLAEPKALFRGWLIAVAAVVTYTVSSRYSPRLAIVVGLLIFCALPWVIVRSRIFNCRNLAHRNIRLGFSPDYRGSYRVYLGYPLLIPLTLGILYPYVAYRQKRFLVENSSFGSTPFRFTARPKEFYVFFLQVLALAVGLVIATMVFTGVFLSGLAPQLKKAPQFASLVPIGFFLVYFVFAIGVMTALNNLVWNRTALGDIRFASDMSPSVVIWLYLSGLVAVACSLGLLFPWAAVRLRRYRYDHLVLRAAGGIEGFVAGVQAAAVGAAGEEIGDVFGLDVDIAL
jgi:uncharacterized membrane protein YjgN (DUF898 family)